MVTPIPRPDFRSAPMEQLIQLSRYYGSDTEFVIAGGGNSSVKVANRLIVKASGTDLATIDAGGFVEMDRAALQALLAADLGTEPSSREERFKEAILSARVHPEKGQRPSVESVLHNILPRLFVVHTHATVANWLACSKDGEQAARELFGEEVLWIPYVDPGYVLARSVGKALQAYEARTGRDCPRALVMQNHGLLVCADTPEELCANTDMVVARTRARVGALPSENWFGPCRRIDAEQARPLINRIGPALRGLLADGDRLKIVKFDDSDPVLSLVGSENGEAVARRGALTPDQIVYCYSFPLWLDVESQRDSGHLISKLAASIRNHIRETGYPPLVVLVKGLGMFTVGDSHADADTVRLCYIDAVKVAAGAERLGGAQPLGARDRQFIETWEVEAYRRKVSAAQRRPGRMSEKVAFVTGAAQGFGREIADALAAEGAYVVLADVNAAVVAERAAEIAGRHGPGRALGLAVDVTDGSSVAAALHWVVREYGGLDLLVSNAGILRAGSVKTQPVDEFELVARVNYLGYFICVQNAAPIMAWQHRARPECWSDIIQINSKSGLAGSNRNSAYAGSKFGGIGLTQSFALELIEDGIKVNAICPGNYFDGPLWSDPETGLFVQYLRTGKVPGAQSIEDVRRTYEAKVPMGRGCTTADVMKAIFYLVDQKYETGQALPVTGGQVMLR